LGVVPGIRHQTAGIRTPWLRIWCLVPGA
jgi:hypothetical protein